MAVTWSTQLVETEGLEGFTPVGQDQHDAKNVVSIQSCTKSLYNMSVKYCFVVLRSV